MDDVRGGFLWPQNGKIPAAVKANKDQSRVPLRAEERRICLKVLIEPDCYARVSDISLALNKVSKALLINDGQTW